MVQELRGVSHSLSDFQSSKGRHPVPVHYKSQGYTRILSLNTWVRIQTLHFSEMFEPLWAVLLCNGLDTRLTSLVPAKRFTATPFEQRFKSFLWSCYVLLVVWCMSVFQSRMHFILFLECSTVLTFLEIKSFVEALGSHLLHLAYLGSVRKICTGGA